MLAIEAIRMYERESIQQHLECSSMTAECLDPMSLDTNAYVPIPVPTS